LRSNIDTSVDRVNNPENCWGLKYVHNKMKFRARAAK
jgi:hypothetical protein